MPLISYDAIVRINKNKNKQQKQAQPHDRWNARHARYTRSTNSASESTGSVRDTIPRQQESASDKNNSATPYYFGGIPKIKKDACCLFSGPGRNKRSRVFFLDGLLNVKDAHQMDSILDSELDVKLRQTLDDVTIENQFLILIIDSLY
jgi:hypothetical protein